MPKDGVVVKVERGWVTLAGQVDYWFQKEAAGNDIRPLHGVVGVSNQVTIQRPVDTGSLSDDITHALHRSWFFDPQTVHVSAEGGKVVLTGTVNSLHERDVAGRTAWAATGTKVAENDLMVV